MARQDAKEFLTLAIEVGLWPKTTSFPLEAINEALLALKQDLIDGVAVIVP